MKVLISGGSKSGNIVKALMDMLSSSGVDFITVKNIEDIPEIFVRGEYFDRAVIIEQSWTNDGADTNENSIRHKLNNFATAMHRQNTYPNSTYIFLAQKRDMALLVSEETLDIKTSSEIIVKEPVYYANFFKALVTYEIGQFPEQLVYRPDDDIITNNDIGMGVIGENGDTPQSEFDTQDLIPEDQANANRLDIDQGIDPEDLPDPVDSGDSDFWNSGFSDGWRDPVEAEPTEDPGQPQDFGDQDQEYEDTGFGGQPQDQEYEDTGFGDQGQDFGDQDQEYVDPEFSGQPQEQDFSDQGQEYVDPNYMGPADEPVDAGDSDFGGIPDFDGIPDLNDGLGSPNSELNPEFIEDTPGSEHIPEFVEGGPEDDVFTPEQGIWEKTPSEEQFTDEHPLIGDLPDYSGPDEGFNGIPQYSDYPHVEGRVNFPQNDEEYPPSEVYPPEEDTYPPDQGDYPPLEEQYPPVVSFDEGIYDDVPPQRPISPVNISDTDYESDTPTTKDTEEINIEPPKKSKPDNRKLRDAFQAFASRGNSIVVTGCGGCGCSTIAMNLANAICNMGYTVLLVDMDTMNKTQSYISKEHYEAVDVEGASVMSAVNSNSGINAYISIIRQGFHLLTMGMASDSREIDEAFNKEKLSRFINLAKTSHNFVIYDIPFQAATQHLEAITYAADNIVLTVDASNWGIAKTLVNICNIGSDDMEETLFSRAQLLFNRYRGLNRVMGKKVKKISDITAVMDKKVYELLGEDSGYSFSNMHICGTIKDDVEFEDGWFESIQYSDTKKGNEIFVQLLKNIVLHT